MAVEHSAVMPVGCRRSVTAGKLTHSGSKPSERQEASIEEARIFECFRSCRAIVDELAI